MMKAQPEEDQFETWEGLPDESEEATTTPEDDFNIREITVDRGQSPIRIDRFLMDRLEFATRTKIQKAIQTGAVLVDGQEVKASYKVLPKQVISLYLPKSRHNGEIFPENIPLDVRYEDEDLMVIYKPEGLVVHPGVGNHSGTLVNALAYYFQQKGEDVSDIKSKEDRPWIIHRIDKNTTGLMLVAKTEQAMNALSKQFFRHTIHRRYWALVWGEPDATEGTIDGNLARNPNNRMQMMVFDDPDVGKRAVTHYTILERLYYVSLVECRLETGRTHQIRAHMRHLGHPLFNDERYGGDEILKGTIFSKYKKFVENCFEVLPRHALHAKEIGFIHPTTGKEMFFHADPPQDFLDCLDRWRNYVQSRKELL